MLTAYFDPAGRRIRALRDGPAGSLFAGFLPTHCRKRGTPPLQHADICERQNTSSIGTIGTVGRFRTWMRSLSRNLSTTSIDAGVHLRATRTARA